MGTNAQGAIGVREGFLKAPKYVQHDGDVYTFEGGEETQRQEVTCPMSHCWLMAGLEIKLSFLIPNPEHIP